MRLARRQSLSDATGRPIFLNPGERTIQTPLVNLYDALDRSRVEDAKRAGVQRPKETYTGPGSEVGVGPSAQSDEDEAADRRVRRMSRQSKGQEEPAVVHVSWAASAVEEPTTERN